MTRLLSDSAIPQIKTMKRIVLLALLLTSTASAAWRDLKAGLDAKTAAQLVGAPLFGNQTRGGTLANWIYDDGGYILFECGRVKFWQAPHGVDPTLPVAAVAPAPSIAPAVPVAPVVAAAVPRAERHPVLKIRR